MRNRGAKLEKMLHSTLREDLNFSDRWEDDADELLGVESERKREKYFRQYSVEQGNTISVTPGEELSLNLTMTNVGNTIDSLNLTPEFNITHVNGDSSSWSATGISASQLAINASQTVELSLIIPDDCWAGTIAEFSLDMTSDGFDMQESVDITLSVAPVSGWRFDLSNASLEVPPEGGSIELVVEQLGNGPQAPWFSKQERGGVWNYLSIPWRWTLPVLH